MPDDPAGRIVVVLDLDGVTDKEGLMDRCARDLALPDWFGRNWDALADCLADPALWPEGSEERGLLVVVTGWRTYAMTRPEEWQVAEEIFAEATDRGPGLFVTLGLGASSERPPDQPG
ncbi:MULTISPECIES: barstar family protein [Streptomyces]|uniref:barstar family protein n=1 Tax=Streptomyces TaxID=1883 RepID=UPI00287FA453|nr:barstar family protein [Streptomyces sp. CGMCC 4.1456]WNF61115.1 barstar family protein [Streptomyces sp. CGMCC 4.1456]